MFKKLLAYYLRFNIFAANFYIPLIFMRISICIALLLSFSCKFFAQIDAEVFKNAQTNLNENEKRILFLANEKFNSKFYHIAITYIDSVREMDLPYLNYIKGVFYAHDDLTRNKALKCISKAEVNSNMISGFYENRAFAYLRVDSFAAAVRDYQVALRIEQQKKHTNNKLIDDLQVHIDQCKNIMSMKNTKNEVEVKSMGSPINSEYSEYCPIITSNENMMVFTYRGPKSLGGKQKLESGVLHKKKLELYFEDIFISKKINDTLWGQPMAQENLDTQMHDAAVTLNSDGTEMFVYRNTGKGNGDLYLSKLKGDKWGKPVIQMHLNSPEWDGSACFLPNQNKIIISSERKGGYGGKDLYYVERIKDNVWGNVKNLGPIINSKYDEDAPFVTADGKILFFSTNNESSIGGYDIERSDMINGFWSKPYNLGAPINTKNDDTYFTVRADGKVAYYSSSQKDGDGAQDIYIVKPGIPGKPSLLLQVEGLVTLDGKPVKATVEMRSMIKNLSLNFVVNANELSGQFLCNLPSKDEYELTVRINKYPPQVIYLNTTSIDTFAVVNVYAEFYSPGFDTDEPADNGKIKDTLTLGFKAYDSTLIEKFANTKSKHVSYKVQIGAYRFPKNFNYNNLISLPKIIMQKDSLGIAHFTIGNCETYNQAAELIKKIKPHIPDAFIVVYEREKRMLLRNYWSNLIKQ